MTVRPDPRLGDWLDIVAALLRDPAGGLPVEPLALALRDSFGATAVGWCASPDPARTRVFPVEDWAHLPTAEWRRTGRLRRHPLLTWYAATGDPAAQTTGRLPVALVRPADLREWRDLTGPYGVTQELAMPLALTRRPRAFVLARGGDDFDERDLTLARRLQPALAGLDRLARVLARSPAGIPPGQDPLTARERAVLSLLAAGLTADGIAHRLGISPRTVHKHLEHAYGKLHVRDKVSAVRRAQRAGILPRPE